MSGYIAVPSEKYYLERDKYEKLGKVLGGEVTPVDMNAACVVEKKGNGLQNNFSQEEIQCGIRERFGLCGIEDYQNNKKGGDY